MVIAIRVRITAIRVWITALRVRMIRSFGSLFATGAADRKVKIWQLTAAHRLRLVQARAARLGRTRNAAMTRSQRRRRNAVLASRPRVRAAQTLSGRHSNSVLSVRINERRVLTGIPPPPSPLFPLATCCIMLQRRLMAIARSGSPRPYGASRQRRNCRTLNFTPLSVLSGYHSFFWERWHIRQLAATTDRLRCGGGMRAVARRIRPAQLCSHACGMLPCVRCAWLAAMMLLVACCFAVLLRSAALYEGPLPMCRLA